MYPPVPPQVALPPGSPALLVPGPLFDSNDSSGGPEGPIRRADRPHFCPDGPSHRPTASFPVIILLTSPGVSRSPQAVSTIHAVVLGSAPPGPFEEAAAFSRIDQVYSWLRQSVVQPIWTARVCGDGFCERPFEFPAYGRWGCEVDCGSADTVSVAVVVSADYAGMDFSDAAALLSMCVVKRLLALSPHLPQFLCSDE